MTEGAPWGAAKRYVPPSEPAEPSPVMKGAQFDLRSNIKAREGSQGTLFHASTDLRTPASRQPRGYSPERSAAVQEAVGPVRMHNEMKEHEGLSQGSRLSMRGRMDRAVHETLARSTMPVEQMKKATVQIDTKRLKDMGAGGLREQGPAGWDGETGAGTSKLTMPGDLINQAGDSRAHNGVRRIAQAHADYAANPLRPSGRPATPPPVKRDRSTRDASTWSAQVMIHEMGHHVSMAVKGNEYSGVRTQMPAGYDIDPVEEGRADAHQLTHYRPDPRVKDQSTSAGYERYNIPQYNESRAAEGQPVAKGTHKLAQERADAAHLPAGHVKGQLPLLNKVMTVDHDTYPTTNKVSIEPAYLEGP